MKKLSKQITIGTDPYTGKRIRKRIYANSATGLKQAEKDAVAQFAKNTVSKSILFGQYRSQWYDAYCTNLAENTKYTYNNIMKNFDPLANKRMDKITRLDLQKLLNDKWDTPHTAKRIAIMAKQIWRSAVFDGIASKNIAEGLKAPKLTKTSRQAFTDKELQAIRTVQLPEQERFLVDVLLQFGLRPGEALALNKQSFNRKNRTLTIDKAVAYRSMHDAYIKSTKTGVIRVLPVPDTFWEKIPKTKTLYYFVDENGQLYQRSQMQHMFKCVIDAINKEMGGTQQIRVTHMTMYSFRHNKASLLYYTDGISLKKKAEYMGHSEEMFLKTYSHLIESKEDTEILRQAVI